MLYRLEFRHPEETLGEWHTMFEQVDMDDMANAISMHIAARAKKQGGYEFRVVILNWKPEPKYCRKCDVAACSACAKEHFENGVCSNCRR